MTKSLRLFGYALLFSLLPIGIVSTNAQENDDGGGFLERLIEDKLSGAGRSVVIRGFEGALSSSASLETLIIADDDGPWVTLNDVVLDWNRSALLRGQLDVTELTAGEILLPRLPKADPEAPAAESTPFSLPELPVSIEIQKLIAKRVVLGEALFGAAAEVSLEGAVSLAGGEGTAQIAIERIDGQAGALTLDGSYDNASKNLDIALDLTEAADGIVANLINLPDRPSIALQVSGTGPLDDFAADIGLDTDGKERLTGAVTLTATGDEGVVARQFTATLGGDIAPVFAPEYRPFFGPDIQLDVKGQSLADGRMVLEQMDLKAQSLALNGAVTIGANGLPELIDVAGEIASRDGAPVLLPVPGGTTRVERIALSVQFDADKSEDWTSVISLVALDRPDIAIDRITLDGTGRIASPQPDQKSVTAEFDFLAEGLAATDADIQRALGEQADGRAEIRWATDAPLVLDLLTLRGASFAFDGAGQIATGDGSGQTDITARLEAANLNAFSGFAGRSLDGAANLELALDIAPLDGRLSIQLDGTATDLKIDQEQADALLAGETRLELRAERDTTGTRLSLLSLINPELTLKATADLTSLASTVNADIRMRDAAVLDANLSGPVDIAARAALANNEWTYDVSAEGVGANIESTGKVTDLDNPTVRLTTETVAKASNLSRFSRLAGRDLAGGIHLTLSGFSRADGSLADMSVTAITQDLQIGDPRIDPLLTGRVDLSTQVQLDGETLTLPQLALNAAGAGLRVNGSATVQDLTSQAPLIDADVTLAADDMRRFSGLAQRDLGGAVDVALKGQLRADASVFDIIVDGQTRALTVGQDNADNLLKGVTEIGLTARRDADTIDLPRLRIANPQISATADGRYVKGESALKADVQIFDLADLDPRMRGTANVNFFAEEVGEVWQVSLDGEGADAVIEATAELRDIFEPVRSFQGTARIEASDLARFAPLVDRPIAGALSANVTGSVLTDLSKFDIDLSANGSNLRTGIAEADQILGARTTVRLDAVKTGAQAPIRVSVLNVDTPTLTVKADGQLDDGGATLQLDARLADIAPFVPGFSGPVTAQGSIGQDGDNYRLNIGANGPGNTDVRVSGTIANTFNRANLDIAGSASLGLANGFIAPRLLDGTVNFDLGLNGPLALSSLSGQVNSAGARAIAPALNLVLEDIDLNASLSGNSVRLNLQGNKQGGGRIGVTGPIALSGGFAADLAIALQGVVVEDPKLYKTTVDGSIAVKGPLTGGARISGTLNLGETNVRIPSTGLGVTGPIPDGLVHVNEPANVRTTRDRAGLITTTDSSSNASGGPAYPLDLRVNAPARIFVRGRGLDAELGGQLTLRGTTAAIIPAGKFELVRGRLDILGKRLNMDEGSITLQGDFDPYIRLVASTDAGDVTVLIVVEGPALEPAINFLSEPTLPEEEVLARLLFGKSLTSISPIQALQLASAVATLAGKGGDGVVGKLRQGIGLDDLDITTDDEGNAGLRAGKYISENIYTDVTVGAGGDAEINLNLDLSPSLTIKGGASNSGETSLGIFFEKDY